MDQASPSKLCATAVTSKSLNPRDALDAVVVLSGAEGDKLGCPVLDICETGVQFLSVLIPVCQYRQLAMIECHLASTIEQKSDFLVYCGA
jgi:hypothetical protein